jgi:hypothetical protein
LLLRDAGATENETAAGNILSRSLLWTRKSISFGAIDDNYFIATFCSICGTNLFSSKRLQASRRVN